MQFTSYLQSGQLTIALFGEIDHHRAKEYITAITGKIETYMPDTCVLDFTDIQFMDSSGIAVLINALRQMERIKGTLYVTGLSAQPMRVFRAAGMEKILQIKEKIV